jgi:ribosomal protein L16 Arg81 hydroxylase
MREELQVESTIRAIDFVDIISPMSSDKFLEHWQKHPCYIKGRTDKFAGLFSWSELNSILETCHCDYPRIRMSKFGVELPAKEYLQTLPFTKAVCIDPDGLGSHFHSGATLIFQHVDEFSPSLQRLAGGLEDALGWPAEVEVIAGNGNSNGLPVHFDANDCFALQLEGFKKWNFYPPTRALPLRRSKLFPRRCDAVPPSPPLTGTPALSVRVGPGDFVYIPRGWWHVVEPEPGPCLSLNPTVYSATIQDFLQWLIDELSAADSCRKHVPLEQDEQAALLAEVLTDITSRLAPKTIQQYRRYLLGERDTPRTVRLPQYPGANGLLTPDSAIAVNGHAPLYCDYDGDSPQFRVRHKGRTFHFPKKHYPMFLALNDGNVHQTVALLALDPNPENQPNAIPFLKELLSKRIISHCLGFVHETPSIS